MDKIKCIIIEDEIPALEEIKYLLKNYDEVSIIGEANDGEKGFDLVENLKPEVVFLDINIPIYNGIELAKNIKNFDNSIIIIFITAFQKYALKAFEINALDYILKPIDEKRFEMTMERLKASRSVTKTDNLDLSDKIDALITKLDGNKKLITKLSCEINGKTVFVNLDEILFCYAENEKTYIKTKNESFITNHTLQEIELKTTLIRTHRSYIVNLDKIKEIYSWFNGTYKLVMQDKSEVPVSRGNVKKIKELLGM